MNFIPGTPPTRHDPQLKPPSQWATTRSYWCGTPPISTWGWAPFWVPGPPQPTGPGLTPSTVFTNVAPNGTDAIRPWVEALRNVGFAVFAKPKLTEDTDVDPDMVAHIRHRHAEGVLRGVIVASADGQNFRELLTELADEGIPVTILGFHEHTSWAVNSEIFTFVDLEEIPGVFREPLPRISLDNLPATGAWLQPFRPLSMLLSDK